MNREIVKNNHWLANSSVFQTLDESTKFLGIIGSKKDVIVKQAALWAEGPNNCERGTSRVYDVNVLALWQPTARWSLPEIECTLINIQNLFFATHQDWSESWGKFLLFKENITLMPIFVCIAYLWLSVSNLEPFIVQRQRGMRKAFQAKFLSYKSGSFVKPQMAPSFKCVWML